MNDRLLSTGNEDVGAFMRALGYDFKSDPGADIDGLLFKRALRLTHPDKVAFRERPDQILHLNLGSQS